MRIGTDMSLATCRAEGYLMMEFKKRELITKGKLNRDVWVTFLATGGYVTHDENGYPLEIGTKMWLEVGHTFNSLMELYEQYKESIDSMCGYSTEDRQRELADPNEYDMLNLASDINAYCGLE